MSNEWREIAEDASTYNVFLYLFVTADCIRYFVFFTDALEPSRLTGSIISRFTVSSQPFESENKRLSIGWKSFVCSQSLFPANGHFCIGAKEGFIAMINIIFFFKWLSFWSRYLLHRPFYSTMPYSWQFRQDYIIHNFKSNLYATPPVADYYHMCVRRLVRKYSILQSTLQFCYHWHLPKNVW